MQISSERLWFCCFELQLIIKLDCSPLILYADVPALIPLHSAFKVVDLPYNLVLVSRFDCLLKEFEARVNSSTFGLCFFMQRHENCATCGTWRKYNSYGLESGFVKFHFRFRPPTNVHFLILHLIEEENVRKQYAQDLKFKECSFSVAISCG